MQEAASSLIFGVANEQIRPDFGGLTDQDPEDFLDGLFRQLDKEENMGQYGTKQDEKSLVRMLYEGSFAQRVGFSSINCGIH